jgi:hypothetical protein
MGASKCNLTEQGVYMNGMIQVSECWSESPLTLAIIFLFIAMLTDKTFSVTLEQNILFGVFIITVKYIQSESFLGK